MNIKDKAVQKEKTFYFFTSISAGESALFRLVLHPKSL
jgi:hypothetical protein